MICKSGKSFRWGIATFWMFAVLVTMTLFIHPVQAYTENLRIWQSPKVSAHGWVTFTRGGDPVGGPYLIICGLDGTDRTFPCECIGLSEPDDISWDITIDWSSACGDPMHNQDQWSEQNQPWPATYTKTHKHSPEEWVVGLERKPSVGGFVVPVDKFGLLAPYINYVGFASTILVATVATSIYAKHVKRRKEKQ